MRIREFISRILEIYRPQENDRKIYRVMDQKIHRIINS